MGEEDGAKAERIVLQAASMTEPEETAHRKKLLNEAAQLGNLEAHFELGWIYVTEGKLDKAKGHFQISTTGGLPAPFAALAHVEERQGELVAAESHYARAIELGLDGRFELARVMFGLGKTVPARIIFRQLVKEDNPQAMNQLAIILFKDGKRRQAEKLWRKAARKGDLDAKANLGRMVISSDFRKRRYRAWLSEAVDARHPGIVNALGNWLAKNGPLDEAKLVWGIAAKGGDEDAHRNLGKLARESGDEDAALEWERAAGSLRPDVTQRLLEKHGLLKNNPEGLGDETPLSVPEVSSGRSTFWVVFLSFLLIAGLLRQFFL